VASAGVLNDGVITDTMSGTPQGSPISPLLANIAMHVLDDAWANDGGWRLGTLVRYADDFVIICPTQARAVEAQARVAEILGRVGLRLHPDKTRIVDLRRGAEGFDFLGFHHHKVASWRNRKRFSLQRWPSAKALASIRAKVKERTNRRWVGLDLGVIIGGLNRTLRGWGNYFRWGNSGRKFALIDSYVHERLAMFMSAKHGRTGRNWGRQGRFNYEWLRHQNVHRLTGTIRRR
jgi:RNA-directed DNA polymerase